MTTGFLITFMTGEIPEEWKNCIVIPIHKKSEKQKLENYREISLLN